MATQSKIEEILPTIDCLHTNLGSKLEEKKSESTGQKCSSDQEIIELLAKDSEVAEAFSFEPNEIRQQKDFTVSKQLLAQGTQSLFKKNYSESLMYINTACRFIPQVDTLLSGLYQLRSTVLLQLKKYDECAADLEKALEKGAPEKIHHKLYDKLSGCFVILKQYRKAKENYQRALSSLDKSTIPQDKKLQLEEHFKDQIRICDSEVAVKYGVKNGTNSESSDAVNGDLNFRLFGMSLDCYNPMYSNLVKCCDVVHIEGKGRGVIAKRDIRPGEILLTEQCHAAVLFNDNWNDHCWYCLQKVQAAVPCPTCTAAVFCKDECLKKATEGFHRRECGMMGLLQALSQGEDTLLCLFALRVLTSLPPEGVAEKKNNQSTKGPITNGDKEKILDPADPTSMNEFLDAMPQDKSLDGVKIGLYSLLLTKHLLPKGETKEKVVEMATRLSHYQRALNITNKAVSFTLIMKGARLFYHSVRIGRALWPTLSLINHSCDPVADTVLLNQKLLVLRSKTTIRAGEEVTISYTGHYSRDDREARQKDLQEGWGFECRCRACEENWPQYLKFENPQTGVEMKCQQCQDKLLKVHSLSLVTKKELKCESCDSVQYPIKICHTLNEVDNWREKLRNRLLSDLDPVKVFHEVMMSQEVLDHVIRKPSLFQARMSELVHHVFLLMSDRQIMTKVEGDIKSEMK